MKTPSAAKFILAFVLILDLATVAGVAQAPSSAAPAPADPAKSMAKSMAECIADAKKIVAQMTLLEKISQVHGSGNRQLNGIPRLNIPQYNFSNGPAGLGNGGKGHEGPATAIPAPIALAATFDVQMATAYGHICGVEAADYSCNMIEAPCINIERVPEGGRAFEGYGEDPFLVGRIAVPVIQAVQEQGVNAEAKHFAANNQEDHRDKNDSVIEERPLREIYLPAFEACVKEGHVDAVMSAYNHLNGVYCSENKLLLTDILRKDWGFEGYVTSDFGAVHSTVPTALSGLDAEMPDGRYLSGELQKAVDAGQVPVSQIDDMIVRRFARMMFRGNWHDPYPNKPVPVKEDGALSRQIADAGMVLLKNQGGVLPLRRAVGLRSIALIGPGVVKAKTGGGGSSSVKPAYTVAPQEGLQGKVGTSVMVTLDDGKDPGKAAELARNADYAIVMLKDDESEGHDHAITFSEKDNALVEAVAAANRRTIVVLKTGSAMLMPWLDHVSAVLEAWYPGEEDGNAVADVLFGDVNPSGKLPVTFPAQVADQPAQVSEAQEVEYKEGIFVGYRYYDAKQIKPLFPFGFGLSYTTFKYENIVVTQAMTRRTNSAGLGSGPTYISGGNGVNGQSTNVLVGVDFDVTNTGAVAGAEVAQVYVGKPALPGGLQEPPDWLKGFQKIMLNPSQKGHVHIDLNARAFSYWDVTTHGWKIAPGAYKILAGSSSRDIRLQGEVKLN